jgi:FkbM family methyltransferase
MSKRINAIQDKNIKQLVNLIKYIGFKPRVILDIGANNGYESRSLANHYKNARVFSFEPIQKVERQGIKNISIIKKVVSNIDGKVYFYKHNNSKLNGMYPSDYFKSSNKVSLPSTKISTWAKYNNIKKIDLVWMDVQQAELEVFKGFGDLLKDVGVIYTEVCYEPYYKGGALYDEIYSYLHDLGFLLIRSDVLISNPHANCIFVNKNLYKWNRFYERF